MKLMHSRRAAQRIVSTLFGEITDPCSSRVSARCAKHACAQCFSEAYESSRIAQQCAKHACSGRSVYTQTAGVPTMAMLC